MASIEILSEVPISMADLKSRLKVIEKRDKTLTDKGVKTRDYLAGFVKLDGKKVKELKENIIKLEIPRLKERHIVKILDIMPSDIDSVKTLFAGDPITIKQEHLQKIADSVKEYE